MTYIKGTDRAIYHSGSRQPAVRAILYALWSLQNCTAGCSNTRPHIYIHRSLRDTNQLTHHHLGCMVRLKHGPMCVHFSRTLKHGQSPCFIMFKKHTEGHALTYLKYVTIASFDPRQL